MAKTIRKYLDKYELQIITLLLVLNLLISFKGRGGIILLSNVALGSSMLAISLLSINKLNEKIKIRKNSILLSAFLMLFWVSYIFSRNTGYGLSELLLFSSSIITYIYLANSKLLKNEWSKLTEVILAAAIITIFFGLYVYIEYPYDRFSSFFYNFEDKFIGYPNALADFLLISFPLIFLRKRRKSIKVILIGLFLAAVFLSFSRGAYLALTLEIGLLGLFFRKDLVSKKSLRIGASSILVTVLCIIGANSLRSINFPIIDSTDKITLQSDEKLSSVNERLDFFRASIQIIQDYPLTGIGSNGFQFVYPRYQEHAFTSSNHPHNLFFKVAVENGLAASLILLMFLSSILHGGFKSKQKNIILISAGISALLAHNLIDYNLNFVPNILILFIMLALVSQQTDKSTKLAVKFIFVPLIIASILIASLSIHEGYYNYWFQTGRAEAEAKRPASALKWLGISSDLIFPRRLYSSIGEVYKEMETPDLIKAEKAYLKAKEINEDDAHAYNTLAEIKLEQDNTEAAKLYSELALIKDPQNFTRFHYNYLLSKEEYSTAELAKYEEYLSDFIPVIANNMHNIVLTDNPEYAIKIAEHLYKRSQLDDFKKLASRLESLKTLEEDKFKDKFQFNFEYLR